MVIRKIRGILLDIAKLIFGGVVLVGIMETNVNPYWLFSIGGRVAIWMAFIGFYVLGLFNHVSSFSGMRYFCIWILICPSIFSCLNGCMFFRKYINICFTRIWIREKFFRRMKNHLAEIEKSFGWDWFSVLRRLVFVFEKEFFSFFLVRFYVFSLSLPCRHAEALVKRAVGMGTHILWKGVYLTLCSSTHRNFANF